MSAHYKTNTQAAVKRRKQAGAYVRGLREHRGMTQVDLASALGYQYFTFISNIENGRSRIPPEDQRRWAETLGVPVKEFVKNLLRYYDPHVYAGLFGNGEDV